jgi:hypothetical protein
MKAYLRAMIIGMLMVACVPNSDQSGTGLLKVSVAPRCPTCHTPDLGSVQVRSLDDHGRVVARQDFLNATDIEFTLKTGSYQVEGGPNGVGCRARATMRVRRNATTGTTLDCY